MIGNVVGNYKVISKIGEGGMGAVYKGIDLMLEREVAIKVLKPELAGQPLVVERFRSEAVTLAKLNHPNVATLFSFFREGDFFFMVLEYVNGTPLDRIIEACGVMTCEQAIPLFCQMLEGIDHAHALGIVHRDIKPANMMLTDNGSLKVLDFGIARALGTARMTRAGHLIGTIEYMSPEQVRGLDTDARSDIYSLGMVLYEMLTGRVPFASDSEFELMKAQVEQLPRPPREFAPDIPEEVEWAILCATEKDPEKRFQTAGAFAGAIVASVNTAMATGALSAIDLRRPTGRLSAESISKDFVPRFSASDVPKLEGFSSGQAASPQMAATLPPTRFAAPSARVDVSSPPKATRLGEAAELSVGEAMDHSIPFVQSASIFDRLNRKHYVAGAAAVATLVLSLTTVSWLFLSGDRSSREKVNSPQNVDSSPSTPSQPVRQDEPSGESPAFVDSTRTEKEPASETRATTPNPELNSRTVVPGDQNGRARQPPKTNDAAREKARRRALAQRALDQ